MANSGDSDASGATHCTSRNSSIAWLRPTWIRPSAKGSADTQIAQPAKTKSSTDQSRRPKSPNDAERISAGPEQLGLVGLAPHRRAHVEHEDREQHRGVEEAHVPFSGIRNE